MSDLLIILREIAASHDPNMTEVLELWDEEKLEEIVEDRQQSPSSDSVHQFGLGTTLAISSIVYHVIKWVRWARDLARDKREAKDRELQRLLLIGHLVDNNVAPETARQLSDQYFGRLLAVVEKK